MSESILLKINVSKIEKHRLFEGKKGKYLDCILIPTPNSEYQDYMLKQSVSREEREQGIDGPIIGGGNRLKRRGERTTNSDHTTRYGTGGTEIDKPPADEDFVPF